MCFLCSSRLRNALVESKCDAQRVDGMCSTEGDSHRGRARALSEGSYVRSGDGYIVYVLWRTAGERRVAEYGRRLVFERVERQQGQVSRFQKETIA